MSTEFPPKMTLIASTERKNTLIFHDARAVWSIRVLNIRASTQIWQKNKSNLRVFPVLILISQEYPQYSISDTKGNVKVM